MRERDLDYSALFFFSKRTQVRNKLNFFPSFFFFFRITAVNLELKIEVLSFEQCAGSCPVAMVLIQVSPKETTTTAKTPLAFPSLLSSFFLGTQHETVPRRRGADAGSGHLHW